MPAECTASDLPRPPPLLRIARQWFYQRRRYASWAPASRVRLRRTRVASFGVVTFGGLVSFLRKETTDQLTPGVERSAAGRFSFLPGFLGPFGTQDPKFAALSIL